MLKIDMTFKFDVFELWKCEKHAYLKLNEVVSANNGLGHKNPNLMIDRESSNWKFLNWRFSFPYYQVPVIKKNCLVYLRTLNFRYLSRGIPVKTGSRYCLLPLKFYMNFLWNSIWTFFESKYLIAVCSLIFSMQSNVCRMFRCLFHFLFVLGPFRVLQVSYMNLLAILWT